jgi:ammonium transporter, Amt family
MRMRSKISAATITAFLAPFVLPSVGLAQASAVNSGDTSWVMTATAFVLLMTPALAFFYGGMVRTKNVVTTLFQSFAALTVVGIVWAVAGYSLAFSTGSSFLGSLDWAFLNNVGLEPNGDYAATIPHISFMLFQCMFAVITPALFTGAFAERATFKGWLVLCALWSLVVYAPVAHWVWGTGGFLRTAGALDFAGGYVVHMTAGFSAIALAFVLGRRQDFGSENRPYDMPIIGLGTGLLFFGWMGFNGGSALGANGVAANAMATSFFSSVFAMGSWALVDWVRKGKPSFMGACIGCVAGLVVITPGAGFVTASNAIFMGVIGGVVCNFACGFIKNTLKLDDTLDVFACHGVGGALGCLLLGVFATKSVNSAGADGILAGDSALFMANAMGVAVVAVYSLVVTGVLGKVVHVALGLRATAQDELTGLDKVFHDEIVNANFETPAHTPESPAPTSSRGNKGYSAA